MMDAQGKYYLYDGQERKEIFMLKRILILVLILCAMTLLATSPNHVTAASENAPKLQATVVVTAAVVTYPPESTPGTIPVTGSQPSMSTLIIFGLLAVLALAVLIGGVALLNRRQP